MKTEIHPDYAECKVTCSCGNAFVTRATVSEMHLELCSECHPFYTGQQKFVDTGGRVGRFERKFGDAGSKVLGQVEQAKEDRAKAQDEAREAARLAREERDKKREERRKRHAERAELEEAKAGRAEDAAAVVAVEDAAETVSEEAPEAVADEPTEAVAEAAAEPSEETETE